MTNPAKPDQPKLDQPKLDQPKLDQPKLDQPRLDKLGLVLRVGLFAMVAWFGMNLFPWMMMPVTGLMVAAALGTFAAAAVASAIVVRVYERGRLSDLGLGSTETSKREFFTGAAEPAQRW